VKVHLLGAKIMSSFVRESKFRHVVLAPFKRETCYDQLKIASHAVDGDGVASNSKFLAYADASGSGSAIGVLPLSNVGKNHVPITAPSYQQPLLRAHAQSVADFAFNPFNRHQLFSCSTDATLKVWDIPVDGLVVDCSGPVCSMSSSSSTPFRALCPHHLTDALIAVRGTRDVFLFDISAGEQLHASPGGVFGADIQSMAWSFLGDVLAVTGKDKKLRLLDFRKPAAVVAETGCHTGVRSSRCVWLGDSPYLVTAGHSSMQERELLLWDSRSMDAHAQRIRLDSSTSAPLLFFDNDTSMLIVGGKGDASIRFFEFGSDASQLHPLINIPTGEVAKGLTLMPKQACDLMGCEVVRMLKVCESSINPISIVVPRKERLKFQEDLYPPTFAECGPSMNVPAWLSGENCPAQRSTLVPSSSNGGCSVSAPSASVTLVEPDVLSLDIPAVDEGEQLKPGGAGGRLMKAMSYGSQLRLRNMYGTENPRSHVYFNIKPNTSNSDSPLIACSDKYWAIPYQGSGGGPVVGFNNFVTSVVIVSRIWLLCSTSANSRTTGKWSRTVA
jgi:coronin-1B/1C/6